MTTPTKPTELTTQQALRYSRQLMLPALDFRGQEALLASSVLLIGMGGLGCAAAPYLVASGVGNITLVDDDTIDRSNLQRQILYREADIGLSKAQQAALSLRQLNADITIDALCQRLNAEDLATLVPQYALVLDCTDNLVTRNAINAACVSAKVPLVSGAAIRFEGQPHAYLNRCTHVAMEMDYQPDRFFDNTGRWLMCATHGATYQPDTGACSGGPCRGGLVKIDLSERDGVVHWHTAYNLKPLEF